MADKYDVEDLYTKIDWEGGIVESMIYGISAEQLPEETPAKVISAWKKIYEALDSLPVIQDWLDNLDIEA